MEVKLLRASEVSDFPLDQVMDIFFDASSIKEFKDINAREKFFHRWCGQYLEKYPELFFIALENERTLGYCCAHPSSTKALEEFAIPGQETFRHLFKDFPVHLHINCHRDARGKGIGKKLVSEQIRVSEAGIHIVTESQADNCGFYRALGFDYEEESEFKGHRLLFMGKKLG